MYRTRSLIDPLTQEARQELERMAAQHEFVDVRRRARGILALAHGHGPAAIADILGVSGHTVYNWAKWWRERGVAGLSGGHDGGRPAVLTPALVEEACSIAKEEALTLQGIRQRLRERHPQVPHFSLSRLSTRLKEHGLRFKRCRLSLKKA